MDIMNSYFCNKCNMPYDVLEEEDKGTCPHCNSTGEYLFSTNYNKKTDTTVGEQFFLPNKNSKPAPQPKYTPPTKPTITCPYCNSTDCKKLGAISRGVSFGLFGFSSGKIGKQWHCNSCKSDF